MNLRHDPMRWGQPPPHPQQPWQQPLSPGGPGLPGWLEERLFDQRIVMVRGPLTNESASNIAAALLTLRRCSCTWPATAVNSGRRWPCST